MVKISFVQKVSKAFPGVHIFIQGTRDLFVTIPQGAIQSYDVEEGVVTFLEAIQSEIDHFVKIRKVDLTSDNIEHAICKNMGLITAVYYQVHGSVFNEVQKEGV